MLANQLTRILSYTKDLDIIKKINNKDIVVEFKIESLK